MTTREVADLLRVKPATIRNWLWKKDRRLPEPVRLSDRALRWRVRDVLARLEEIERQGRARVLPQPPHEAAVSCEA